MEKKQLLLQLQKKFQEGGYALIYPKSGRVAAFSENLKKLYQTIDQKKIDDKNKLVMYIPPPHVAHVF